MDLNDTSGKINSTCDRENAETLLLVWWIVYAIPGVMVLIVYSLQQKRTNLCLNCCHGVPGILVPINLLNSSENRLVFVTAFGAAAANLLVLLRLDFSPLTRVAALQGLLTILFAIILAIVYSPIFVSVNAPNHLSGYIVGLLYTAGWCAVQLSYFVVCSVENASGSDLPVIIIIYLPVFICLALVLLWFLKALVTSLKSGDTERCQKEFDKPYQVGYVEKLLRRNSVKEREEEEGFALSVIDRVLYKWDKNFKYPTRILATYLIAAIYIFQLSVIALSASIGYGNALKDWLNKEATNRLRNESIPEVIYAIEKISSAWIGSFGASCMVSTLLSVFYVLQMLISYRRNIRRLYKGDKSFLPDKLPSPASTVLATFKYSGYQIAYVFWGWFIIALILLIVCLIVSLCSFWIEVDIESFFSFATTLAAPVVFSLTMWFFQFLFVKLALLEGKGAKLVLTNRRLYHAVGFFFFFYNVVLGVWSCLLRLLYSLGLGILFISRLDVPILPRGLDMFDPGYKVYVGYMVMDYQHTNPVLVSFVYIICVAAKRDPDSDSNSLSNSKNGGLPSLQTEEEAVLLSKRARTRWFVAVTLIRNPKLKKDRFSGTEFKDERPAEKAMLTEKEKFVSKIPSILESSV